MGKALTRSGLVLALAVLAASCGQKEAAGPEAEDMKAAASALLQVPAEKITQFEKGSCEPHEKGFICTFELYIDFTGTPSRQELDRGYFFQSGEEWVMEPAV